MAQNNALTTPEAVPQIVALKKFCRDGDISDITAWRWRKNGWLKTVNISGRQYVTAEALAEFNRRAAAGEFAAEHKTPKRCTPNS